MDLPGQDTGVGSVQFSSVAQSCPALCNPMNHSMPDLPVHHQLQESTQTHVHWVGDAIQLIRSRYFLASRWEQSGSGDRFKFLGFQNHCGQWLQPWRCLLLGRKAMINLDSVLKSKDITLPTKVCKSYGFSSSHVWMWELDHKEGWMPKNWCFQTVVLEKTESLLDCKEIKPVNPKGHQSWIFIGRTDAKAEAPILWPPDAKRWLIRKDPDAGKDRRQEKGTTEDKMVGWHHQLDGHEFEQGSGSFQMRADSLENTMMLGKIEARR